MSRNSYLKLKICQKSKNYLCVLEFCPQNQELQNSPSRASIEGKSLQLDTPVESVTHVFHKLDQNVAVVMTVPSTEDTFQQSVGRVDETRIQPEIVRRNAIISVAILPMFPIYRRSRIQVSMENFPLGMAHKMWDGSSPSPVQHLYLRATSFSANHSGTHSHLLYVVSVSMGCTLIITPHCVQGDLQGEEVS